MDIALAAAAGLGIGFGLACGVVTMRTVIRWSEKRNGN